MSAPPWNLRYASHLGVLGHDRPQFLESVGNADPLDHMRFAADLGFAGITDNFLRERTVELQAKMGQTAERLGLAVVSLVGRRPGASGLPWNVPGEDARAAIVADMADCLETTRRTGARLVVATAPGSETVDRQRQVDAYVGHLSAVAPMAERAGVMIGVEPVSAVRVPDLLIRHVDDGAEVVDRVGHPAVGLVFDTFHVHVTDGDVARRLRQHAGRIVAVQIVDCPSRFEPGSGEIDFPAFLTAFRETGLGVIVELEHYHSTPGADGERRSLQRLRALDAMFA